MYDFSYANIIKRRASSVGDGILQRDVSMIHGGHGNAGATTLIMKDGMLIMPPDGTNVLLRNEKEFLLLLDALRPLDDDVIIIGTSKDKNIAREVAMAATMTLF